MTQMEYYARLLQKPAVRPLLLSDEELGRNSGSFEQFTGKFVYQFFEGDLKPGQGTRFVLGPQDLNNTISSQSFDTGRLASELSDIPGLRLEIPTPTAWLMTYKRSLPHLHCVDPAAFERASGMQFDPLLMMTALMARVRRLGACGTGRMFPHPTRLELDRAERLLLEQSVQFAAASSETLDF